MSCFRGILLEKQRGTVEGRSWGLSWGIGDLQKGTEFLWGALCHSQRGMFESLHSHQAWQSPASPLYPQPLQGSATTRDGHKCHQIHPPLTLQPLGFVLRYLWLPYTVCHLSLLSSRANYNY